MPDIKLKQKHFRMFCKECERWQRELGLQSWSIYYLFEKMKDCFAAVEWDLTGRCATITLNVEWEAPTINIEKQIRRSALHECLELLVAPVEYYAKQERTSTRDLTRETHTVIRTLENVLIR